jgi:hypothetical protein
VESIEVVSVTADSVPVLVTAAVAVTVCVVVAVSVTLRVPQGGIACDSISAVLLVIFPDEGRTTTSYAGAPPGTELKVNDALAPSSKMAAARRPLSINCLVKWLEL